MNRDDSAVTVALSRAQVSDDLDTLLPEFNHGSARIDYGDHSVEIAYSVAGSGPPLLLLHGHPQTRAIWSQVVPDLVGDFTVVLADLRGYGDSSKPVALPDQPPHSAFSKRQMAADQMALMRALGFEQFGLGGHDRGGRVAHRLALDYASAVTGLLLLDIAPTRLMYEQTSMAFATAYWHWFYLIQPEPLPETMINRDPVFYLRSLMGNRSAGLTPFSDAAFAEYCRAISNPGTVHAICEDYRASATIDLEHDRADQEAGNGIRCPLRVVWAADGIIGGLFDPLLSWQSVSQTPTLVSGRALACGHYMPEQAAAQVSQEIEDFFNCGTMRGIDTKE